MRAKSSFFHSRNVADPTPPRQWLQERLKESGIRRRVAHERIEEAQRSVKVFYNRKYLNRADSLSVRDSLTKIPAVNVAGDRAGVFQNGLSFRKEFKFADIPSRHAEFLSPEERLVAGKKIIYSRSEVFAQGGYPVFNPVEMLEKSYAIGLFSMPGASFENHYLHSRLFILDVINNVIKKGEFADLYGMHTPTYEEAKQILGAYDLNESMVRIRTGLPYLSKSLGGYLYPSFGKSRALIFMSDAYFKHQLEDVSLLLTTVNEMAMQARKPALLKATAVGMGFFAKIDTKYDIQYLLFPYFLRAYRQLLTTHKYPWISKIEFPIFDDVMKEIFNSNFALYNGPVEVKQRARDVLTFAPEEIENNYLAAVNPSDAFSYSGNEWGYGSVEAMIGNNTTMRFDQVFHANPQILESDRHYAVNIHPHNFSAEIEDKDHAVTLKC